MKEIRIILHNIRSSLNVGAIFRTADGAGVKHIYLTGYTPTPIDRFGRNEASLTKTSLGAENLVPWEKADIKEVPKSLKMEKYYIVGVEQTEKSINYKDLNPKNKTVFIFGNEVGGIDEEILKSCDEIIQIPMAGGKESLNVSVAAGIILFNYLN